MRGDHTLFTTAEAAGFDASQGIMTIAYLKDSTDPQWANDPEFLEWKRWMEKWNPTGSLADGLNVYPYALTATLVEVLKRCGDNLTRANVMKQATSLHGLHVPMPLPGITINTSPTDYYPIQSLRLTRSEMRFVTMDILSGPSPRTASLAAPW
jgi:branched-chain amino acid transport system substrate-binding protein